MARKPWLHVTNKDVEYSVSSGRSDKTYKKASDALEAVAELAMSQGEATLDVVIFSAAGAKYYGGDDAVEQYEEDPEASVFERFEFRCNAVGRVP